MHADRPARLPATLRLGLTLALAGLPLLAQAQALPAITTTTTPAGGTTCSRSR